MASVSIPAAITAATAAISDAAATAATAVGIGSTATAAAGTATAAGTLFGVDAASTGALVAGATDAAASSFPWLAASSLATGLVGGGISAYGQYEQGQAAKGAANYNSAVAKENAQIAQQNVNIAGQSAEAQAGIEAQKTRSAVGSIIAGQAASGLDINTGSPVDVRQSANELGKLDALTVRSNAIRQAYGYETKEASLEAESALDKYEAEAAGVGGELGAGGTFLGAAGEAGTNFARYLYQGGLTF